MAKSFKDHALQIINANLEETEPQHPLDISQIFNYDRPTLGGTVPLKLYRTVRLLAFRETLGSKISSAILKVSGRSVAWKMGIQSIPELIQTLEELSVAKSYIEEQTDDRLVMVSKECATCSGMPAIGEAICQFEAGFIAGSLESMTGNLIEVVETNCWGLGDTVCRWEARRVESESYTADPLEMIMSLASKTASAIDSAEVIRQSNRQLREAYKRLRESERLKKDLTDMIVHDMRTPLTSVLGAVQTLGELMENKLSPQESELLGMSLSSGQLLLQMINDLLDISRLEEHKISLRRHPASISELVEDAVGHVNILTRRKKLKLNIEIPQGIPQVVVDKDRMVRVLTNLLGNAVKYTASGGSISVSATYDPDGGIVKLSVSDTGEGIPKEYHTKIFDKFVQVDSRKSRGRSSTGLGLTFCKLVVEAHGGSIWVESEPGMGSTFNFTVPITS